MKITNERILLSVACLIVVSALIWVGAIYVRNQKEIAFDAGVYNSGFAVGGMSIRNAIVEIAQRGEPITITNFEGIEVILIKNGEQN